MNSIKRVAAIVVMLTVGTAVTYQVPTYAHQNVTSHIQSHGYSQMAGGKLANSKPTPSPASE